MNDKISDKDLENLLVAAFEGGINYWCNELLFETEKLGKELIVYERILKGEEVILFSSKGIEKWLLSKEKLLKAIPKVIAHFSYTSIEDMMSKHDANTGNTLVQFALFDKIVFE